MRNYILLVVKYFIWKSKFQTAELNFLAFQMYLKYKLEDIKNAYIYQEKDEYFEPWTVIYDFLVPL